MGDTVTHDPADGGAPMSALLGLLADSLAFLLEPTRFRIVDSRSGERGDASLTLASANMQLQIVLDRGQTSVRIQPGGTSGDWFWIGVVRRAVDGDVPGSDMLDEDAIEFLRSNIDDLDSRSGDRDLRHLLSELRTARDSRAGELFGGPSE